MGRLLGARYRVDEEVGHGGMATVWSGYDLRLRRRVAVKILDPAMFGDAATRERFWREAQAVAALPHPHIVAVYDVAVEADEAYVVMELVDGPSVLTLLQDGPLPRAQAVDVAVQTCAALSAAHAAGMVHRDVTPANLLLTSAGTVKVCDFGIAAWQEAAYPSLIAGTRGYTAPEQAEGGPVDPRTDLYGLGCTLYAMLTGAPPPTGRHAMGELTGVRDDLLRAGIPAELADLVDRLTATDPQARPRDAEQAAALLRDAADAAGPPPPEATVPLRVTGPLVGVAAVPAPPASAPRPAPARAARDHDRPDRWLRPVVWATTGLVAIVAGLMLILVATAGPPTDGAAAQPSTTAQPSAPRTGSPAPRPPGARPDDPLGLLRAEIDRQAKTGGITGKNASQLRKQLQDVEKRLRRDGDGEAAEEARELLEQLRDMRGDGEISAGAYLVLAPIADRLAADLDG